MPDENGPTIQDFDPANQESSQEPVAQDTSYAPVEPESPWADILAKVPEELRGELNPALEQYTQRVRSDYEPYQFLLENEVAPETVQYAMNILTTLNQNPRQLYDAIGQYYKYGGDTSAQPQTDPLSDEGVEGQDDPRIAQLEQGIQTLARVILEERQQKDQQAEDQRLQKELDTARAKYGEYDEGYVLGLALNGKSVDEAVRAYKQLEQKLVASQSQQKPASPVIMGSGGGAPGSGAVDPRKLSGSETKNLVVQMLQNANRS